MVARDQRPRERRLLGPFVLAGSLALASGVLYLRDPHVDASWGRCPSIALFGLACPFCGGLRAMNDLTNLRIVDAFFSNPLLVSAVPLVLAWWISVVRDRWTGSTRPWMFPVQRGVVAPVLIAVCVAFSLYRNLPIGAAFYP